MLRVLYERLSVNANRLAAQKMAQSHEAIDHIKDAWQPLCCHACKACRNATFEIVRSQSVASPVSIWWQNSIHRRS